MFVKLMNFETVGSMIWSLWRCWSLWQ